MGKTDPGPTEFAPANGVAGAIGRSVTFTRCGIHENVELHLHAPIRLYRVVLSTGIKLPLLNVFNELSLPRRYLAVCSCYCESDVHHRHHRNNTLDLILRHSNPVRPSQIISLDMIIILLASPWPLTFSVTCNVKLSTKYCTTKIKYHCMTIYG
jgi:hypothetical protein